MNRIAVLTSGGDAPGMNATIRACIREGIARGLEMFGVYRGFTGLIEGDIFQMNARSVSNIIQMGGTILKSSRSEDFKHLNGRKRAAEKLREHKIEGLIVIGGDGSFRGAHKLAEEIDIKVIGIPGTIDNDIYGTDFSLGFDTAVNTAVEAVDKIRDTAGSHDRLFFTEVMGRHAGYIAMEVGLSCGAEEILIPERKTELGRIAKRIMESKLRGKASYIIIVAEGDEEGDAFEIGHKIKRMTGMDNKVCVLGHIQRGGSPTARDRILGTRMGVNAVQSLINGESDKMVAEKNGKIILVPLQKTWESKKKITNYYRDLIKNLSI